MRGEEKGKLLLEGCRVLVWDDEKVVDMDNGDGGTTRGIYLVSLKFTLKKRAQLVSFMLYILYHIGKYETKMRRLAKIIQ